MKILGIDYGTKRVGLALSDEGCEFAFPYIITPLENALTEIAALVGKEQIKTAVVGYSLASNGKENDIMSSLRAFGTKLASLGLEVVFEREDFSTFEAHRYQTKAGNRDDSAAAIILQRFLDKQRKVA